MCRQCGALIGAQEIRCSVCGAPSPQVLAQEQARRAVAATDPDALRFMRAIVSRPATFTIIFISVNVFLYLLVIFSGGSQNPSILIGYGAKVNQLIDAGEWWRLVTPIFLHGGPGIGVFHLLVNMYGLFMLGPYVEKLYGSARFVVFWIVTGVAGVAASYYSVRPGMEETALGRFLFRAEDVPSVGASGALFGLVGVLFVFGIKFRHELPEGFKRAFGTGMLPIIIINLFIGFTIPIIDNAAHLGGLLSGMALALFVGYKRPGERRPAAVLWHILQAFALTLVALSFLMVGRNFNAPSPSLKQFNMGALTGSTGIETYLGALNESGPAFNQALEGDGEAVERVIQKIDSTTPLDEQDTQFRGELESLLLRAREFGTASEQERRTPRAIRQRNELVRAYNDWQLRFRQWVESEGARRHGITVQKNPASPETGQPDAPQNQQK